MRRSNAPIPSILIACLIAASAPLSIGVAAADESARAPGGYVGRGLYLPAMSAERGRRLFATRGCVVCHSVNGVGGEHATPMDAAATQGFVSPFDFVGRMWRGAQVMVALQQEMIGEQLGFTGQELADIIAFVHDEEEQKKLSAADLPARIRDLVESWSP